MGGSSRATGGEAVSERKKKKTDAASVPKSVKTNLLFVPEELKGDTEDGEARLMERNWEHEKAADDSGGEGLIALVALASKEDQLLAAGLDEGEIPGPHLWLE